MGQTQSTQHGSRAREFSKVDDSELDFDITKKIKTDANAQSNTDQYISVDDDGGHGYIISDDEKTKKNTVPVVFRWEYGGKEVYLSGSFDDWKTKVPMTYSGGEYNAIIDLPSGTHQFKYLVDGKWVHDPNQDNVDDTFNGRNNEITVKESDFDFTEALMKDESLEKEHSSSFTSLTRNSPPGSYGQLTPTPGISHLYYGDSSMPPSLPPHLLNVILNRDNDHLEDPTMLPVPNHVALNHLYALSIKDSVMTLSGTHRYKRKYVTTVLYKPVVLN